MNPTSANLTVASISSAAAQNLTLRGTSTGNSVTGAIATLTGTLSKSGTGTWVLGGNNTFSGTTGISGGTLVLDYGSTDSAKIGNAALTLNGGNLVLRGGTHAQAVTLINFYSNTYSSITREAGSGATLANAGVIQANGAGNTSSTLSISEGGIVTTTTANAGGGILSNGKITIGSDFATNVTNVIQAYSGYTTVSAGDAGDIAVTNRLTGGGSASASLFSYALKILSNANDNILTLGSARDLIISNAGTLLYAGGVGTNGNYTIDGSATSEVRTTSGAGLHINVASGTLTVNTTIGNSSDTILVKTGAGTLVVGGAYAGVTNSPPVVIQQGVLRVANSVGLGSTNAGTSVQFGSALELSQTTGGSPVDITIGAETLALNGTGISNGGALRNHSGSNTYGGLITIGASGARINSNESTSLALTGGITTAANQDVTFGGAGNTTVSTAAITGAGGVIKDEAGTTTLSGTHTYTGATTVSGGTLLVSGSISGSVATVTGAGSTLGGTGTVGAVTVNSGAILQGGDGVAASGALTSGGNVSLTDGSIIKLSLGAANAHSSLTRSGGTWQFDSNQAFSFTGTQVGTFDNIIAGLAGTETNLITGGSTAWDFSDVNWSYAFAYDNAGDVDLTIIAVPEPNVAVTLLGGAAMLLGLRRRRRA